MTTLSPALVWVLIVAAGAGTWLLRISFLGLVGRDAVIPDLVMRILRLVPAAVFAAIVAPALTHASGGFDLTTDRLLAGLAAGLVAWRTRHVLLTIATGMGVLWALQALG